MKLEVKKFLLTCPLALATLLIPSLLENYFMIVISLFTISLIMLAIDWSIKYLILFIAIMISGPIAESVAIYFGLWNYSSPFFLGIPIWLPFVWGNAGLYIIRLKALIDKI